MDGNLGVMKSNTELEKKASAFLDMLYCKLGGEVIKDAPKKVFDDWDKIVKFEHITYKIEEKARIGIWDDLLVELIEDLKTGDLGWFYQTKADKIIYSFFDNKEAEFLKKVTENKSKGIIWFSKFAISLPFIQEIYRKKSGKMKDKYDKLLE